MVRSTGALDRLLNERRSNPDRGKSKSLDSRKSIVVDAVARETGEVTTVEPRIARGIESRGARAPAEAAGVVGSISIAVAIGHDEVELTSTDR